MTKRRSMATRRSVLKSAAGTGLAGLLPAAWGQTFDFKPNQRYPDPALLILDPSFAKYRLYSSTLEQVASGMRWAEGPVYFPDGGYLLVSDIPNNRIMKYSEKDGSFTVFRNPSNYANGNTRDRQGRLVTCEHSVTRRITRTEKDGKVTVLADSFEGKRLNAPNDIVVKSDDSIWFSDPLFGINGEWEGSRAKPEQANTNVFRLTPDGKLTAVITDLVNPNGLAFSPDEAKLYVVEWKGTPNRSIWSYDVGPNGTVSNKTKLIDAADQGSLDGFRVDRDGNLWCGWGSNGALQSEPTELGGRKVYQLKGRSEDLDGVMVFSPQGKPLAFLRLPERCANLTFGGPKNNRLYMASSHSVYAMYFETHGAV
ncbi:MAG TPA: SMP-30/gluconolactonase/LRE family protein [Burkholderiaceae bacterium]|nr:SMP-30/gluconolactonase/LRE family protein [Burkholderiaceae bacterium]